MLQGEVSQMLWGLLCDSAAHGLPPLCFNAYMPNNWICVFAHTFVKPNTTFSCLATPKTTFPCLTREDERERQEFQEILMMQGVE